MNKLQGSPKRLVLSNEVVQAVVIGIIAVFSLAVTIRYAVGRGQDVNWDQQNYHISVPFLLAHDTFWDSIAPAGIQSYFTPYVLQAQFFALTHLPPRVFAFVLAIFQSVGFMLAGVICVRIARDAAVDRWRGAILGVLGFFLCLASPMALSEAGTTFIDLLMAIPVVAAYAILLQRNEEGVLSWVSAGLLLGAATALKLTNGVFVLGAIGFALAGAETLRRRLGMLCLCWFSSLLAFLAIGGSWHFGLWERFGNPFFPYFNRSDSGYVVGRDGRFLPQGVLDIWRYPLYWLFGGSPQSDIASPSAELHFIDARWAIVTFGGVIFLAALVFFSDWRRRVLRDRSTGLVFAVLLSYMVWLFAFGIHRYMIPIELLAGAVVLLLILRIPLHSARIGLAAAAVILCWAVQVVPDWGHLPWRSHWQTVSEKPLDLEGGSNIVFLTAKPSSFVVTNFPADTRYVGIDGDFDLRAGGNTVLVRQLDSMLAADPPPALRAIDTGDVPRVAAEMLGSRGLAVGSDCRHFTMAGRAFRLCNVVRKDES